MVLLNPFAAVVLGIYGVVAGVGVVLVVAGAVSRHGARRRAVIGGAVLLLIPAVLVLLTFLTEGPDWYLPSTR